MVYHHLGESYVYHGNGKLRMCVYYRQLNNNTKKDSYALPRIEELLDSLSGSTYFATVDMKSGYHQVEILEQLDVQRLCDGLLSKLSNLFLYLIEHGWWYSPVTLFEWSIII
jgi:hypothetical protein